MEDRDRMTTAPQPTETTEMREFALVVRQALLLIVGWVERRYRLRRECPHCGGAVNKY